MSDNSSETKPKPAPRSRWKRLRQNLLLSLATFIICVAAFEGILRLCGYGNLEIYQADPKLYWKLKPNQDCYTKIGRKPVHINSHGTRGPEFQTEKPAGTLRILSLGDSRTFGWGLADEETYSRRLQHLLQSWVGDSRKVEVINAGVNAWSYPQMTVYFRDTGLKYHPDVVIVAGANLWTQFSESNSPQFVRKFLWRVRLKNFLRRFAIYHFIVEVELKEVYERYRTRFIPVDPKQDQLFKAEQQKDPYGFFRSAIESLCEEAQQHQVKAVLLYLPELTALDATNTPIQTVMSEVHAKCGAPLVTMTPFLQAGGKRLYLDADPVHYDARGNELIAQQLFDTLTNLVSRE